MGRRRILIAEGDVAVAAGLRDVLEANGFETRVAASWRLAIEACAASRPDAAVLGTALPDGSALDLLPRLQGLTRGVAALILAGPDSTEIETRALQEGSEPYLLHPVEPAAALALVRRALETQRLRKNLVADRGRRSRTALDPFTGDSDAIRRCEEEARGALDGDLPVLIEGESGVGKGVLAGWLHRHGSRAEEPFVDFEDSSPDDALDRAGLGSGSRMEALLEIADRGTLFVDEIADRDPSTQDLLLRVIEEHRFRSADGTRDREVDVRVVASTRHDLIARIREQRFREDLFLRLGAVTVRVPALRERPADVVPLALGMLGRFAADTHRPPLELALAAAETLALQRWPGNLRELRHVIERGALLADGGALEPRHLGLGAGATPAAADPGDLTLAELERRHITLALEREGGHVERASRRLGIPRSTLYQRLKTMGISLRI